MSRHLTFLFCILTLVAGCSRNPEQTLAASPTAPSAAVPGSLLGPTSVAPGGVSGKFDVSFPARNESFDFRNQLEVKYQTGLGRSAAATFVDREGEVVWTQEYIRYRVNGCDHGSATQRVMAQIDGNPAGQVCGAPPDGLVAFPPRTDSFDFRRQLESRYQQFARGASQSTVDAEGGVIWTQEYLRYRVNQCDHPTSVQKVFSQIDGGGVSPTCFVPPCVFTVAPTTQNVPAAGGTFTAVVTKTSGGDCTFAAESLGSFVSLVSGTSGTAETTTADLHGRAKLRRRAIHADSGPLDQQLDAARDQPGGLFRLIHHDRSAKQREPVRHVFDQNDVDALRLSGDRGCDGWRNVLMDRQLHLRLGGHSHPERRQLELHNQPDLRRTRIDIRWHRDRVECDADRVRCQRYDDCSIGIGQPTGTHHQVLHLLIPRGVSVSDRAAIVAALLL